MGHKFRCPACARMDFVPPRPDRESGRYLRGSGAIPIFGAGGSAKPVFGRARLTIKRSAPMLEPVESENTNRHRVSATPGDSTVRGMTGLNSSLPEVPRTDGPSRNDEDEASVPPAPQPPARESPADAAQEGGERDDRNLLEALADCGFDVQAVDVAAAENREERPEEAG